MIKDKTAIGIIPARGGSKGLPGKNILDMNGKPLLAWTIEKALKSRLLDEVMVTTEDMEIASVARRYGAAVPFMRPVELAGDEATTVSVVDHVLGEYENNLRRRFDYIVLLEPTSPLREDDDIDNMLQKLDGMSGEADGIVSIGEIGENPAIVKKIADGRLVPFCENLPPVKRRQDFTPAYFPFGTAYIIKTTALREERTFYPRRCAFYIIKRYQNYEIDDIYDFLAAAAVMRREWRLE